MPHQQTSAVNVADRNPILIGPVSWGNAAAGDKQK